MWEVFPQEMWAYPLAMATFVLLIGGLVFSLAGFNGNAPTFSAPRQYVPLLLWALLTWTIGRWVLRGIRGRAQAIAALELAAKRCPSCGYNLREQTKQSDGCIVCPECGGAWRSAG